MNQATTPQIRDLAERLIAFETSGTKSSGPAAAFAAAEKLRPKLAGLMGNIGFRALLSRALARAGQEVPSLRKVQVEADGTLGGIAEFEANVGPSEIAESRVVLVAHLFELLVAFIGEELTLQLVREVWPKLPVHDLIPAGDTDE